MCFFCMIFVFENYLFSGIIKFMNYSLSQIKNVLFQVGLALLANIITWLVIYTQIKPSSELTPLHYGVFYGTDLIGKGHYIYLVPLAGLLILGVNYYFYRHILEKEPLAAKSLMAVALVVQILILLAILFLKSIIVI